MPTTIGCYLARVADPHTTMSVYLSSDEIAGNADDTLLFSAPAGLSDNYTIVPYTFAATCDFSQSFRNFSRPIAVSG